MFALRPSPNRAANGRAKGFVGLSLAVLLAACGQAPVSQNPVSGPCVPNQCQISGTLRADNTCAFTPKADGTGCDDNNSCTLFDTCKSGVCMGGTKLKDGATCDDKNVCTQTDICQSGICVGTNPLICNQGDACHPGGTCDPVKGCVLLSYGPCVVGLPGLPLEGCVQSDYTASITLGGQPFSMLIDSGSTTTAVATAQCANCRVTPTYTPSADAQDQRRTAQAAYGDSTGWSGKIYMDTLFAGTSSKPVTPATAMRIAAITKDANPNQPFFTGSTCGATVDPSAYQGILGLGPTDLALNYTDSLMDKVAATGKLTWDAFAVNLCDVGGQMWFGGFNPTAVAHAPNFTPMVTRNMEGDYYSVAIDDLLVGSTSVGLAAEALGPAIVDTATRPYTMTQAAFDATTALIVAQPGFKAHFDATFFTDGVCAASKSGGTVASVDAALPSITLTMPSGGNVNALPVTMSATASYLQPQALGSDVVYCSTLAVGDSTLWGSAFMRGQVVIFDREHEQIGFAPQVGCDGTLPVAHTGN